jgi:hypothetical protein
VEIDRREFRPEKTAVLARLFQFGTIAQSKNELQAGPYLIHGANLYINHSFTESEFADDIIAQV